ncbi:pyrroline-5-carboxylate reductase [Candidatus Woesearchaeota archaeon]|nr:pyrroline-5-carboxylate reductase [Candidatus Woesearchaeota archaeon]
MIGFIGFGRMGSALAKGILEKKVADRVIAFDKNVKINENKIVAAKSNKEVADKSKIVFIAVKPKDFGEVLGEIKDNVKDKIVVSIAAGIRLSFIESRLGKAKVVRVMPNLPCIVGEMAAAFSRGKNCSDKDAESVKRILESSGIAFEVKEELMDVVTALSGSGPAYFAYFAEILSKKAAELGLEKDVATKLAVQTMLGAAKLLQENNLGPEELVSIVKTKGGTTEAGMNKLEKSESILKDTIEAAFRRGRELGND